MMMISDVPDGYIRISWFTPDTECLGPGKRFALWVQGCSKNCRGCISEPLRDLHGGKLISIDELVDEAVRSSADGISISGGEPFLQAGALSEFVEKVKRRKSSIGVIVYTGCRYEELTEKVNAQQLLSHIDVLVDGEYVEELDDGKPMRGSSNQRVIYLTDRYSPKDMPAHRTNRFIFSDGIMRMIGIPSEGARKILRTFRD